MDHLVSQNDELVQVQSLSCREIAPGVLAADDRDSLAGHHMSGFEAAVSLAASTPDLRGCARGHDVERLGGHPATGERQPQQSGCREM